jgi:hypothetical protein
MVPSSSINSDLVLAEYTRPSQGRLRGSSIRLLAVVEVPDFPIPSVEPPWGEAGIQQHYDADMGIVRAILVTVLSICAIVGAGKEKIPYG